jgi:hypothetical protein
MLAPARCPFDEPMRFRAPEPDPPLVLDDDQTWTARGPRSNGRGPGPLELLLRSDRGQVCPHPRKTSANTTFEGSN